MGINGIGTAGYQMAGYTARNTERNADSGTARFMEIVEEKADQDKAVDHDEQAFEMVGPHAPQEVKDAWMEAAKEVYANGAGIRKNGMMSHISQMMVQRCNKMLRGEADYSNILGSTVGSAIRATKQALYDLDHPLGSGYRSIEAQQARVKEREFYVAFLEKLDAANDTKSSFSDAVVAKSAQVDSNEVQKKTSAVLDRIGSQAPDEVKNAWMEAEKETGAFFTVYGMYITADGKHAHMTQMGIDRFVRWYRGEINPDDLLGNSVESAIKAVNKWIYDLEHPLAGQTVGSMEDRQLLMKEREFYDVFRNKLLQLSK